jgi:glutathione S-transferase
MSEYQFYSLITVVLFFKMLANSVIQALGRINTKTFTNPEDASYFGVPAPATEEAQVVKRAAAVWRNDLENIPIFLFLGLEYVNLGCWSGGAYIYFSIFTGARILHTVAYMQGMQPSRTIFWGIGLAICVTMSIQIVLAVLV